MSSPAQKPAQGQSLARSFRAGGYSVVAALVVIAIAIFVNLMADRLPATYTKLDITAGKLFEISDQTKKVLAGLESDVDIYWITQPSQEDLNIRQLLELYAGLSSKIKLHPIDPVVYPNFGAQYTSETVHNNSLVVQTQGRSKFVSLFDLYLYEIDYATNGYKEDWNGESALTSAIDYVANDNLPILYTLKGHGEIELSETVRRLIGHQNMILKELQLLTVTAIPEDAGTLIINGPTADLSPDEAAMLKAFLDRGGKLMLFTDYLEYSLPTLYGLLADYGVSPVPGIVVEGSMDTCLQGVAYLLLPYMRYHASTAPLVDGNYRALMPIAQGIAIEENLRAGLSVSPLLVTSGEAFSKVAGLNMTTYEKEPGDVDGPFYLGVAIEEGAGEDATRIVWLTSSQVLDDTVNANVAGANHDMVVSALGWMNERENAISIHAKSLAIPKLVIPSSAQTRLSIILVGVMPLTFLAFGILITIRRRRA